MTVFGMVQPVWAGDLLAYVVLGEKGATLTGETVPVARVVLEPAQDAACATMTMTNGQGSPIQLVLRPNPNPTEMPVTVCEAALPFAANHQARGETWTVTDGKSGKQYKVQLPSVGRSPEVAVILGDSGCRGNKAQPCTDKDWPLPTVMAKQMGAYLAKENKPAVILHVGDFKYRGKQDDSGKPQKWSNWKADFFTPMSGSENVFAMAPLVVARGNHELCKSMGNNGDGWYFLLDPTSRVAGNTEQQVKDHSCQGVADGMTRPYRLDFANDWSVVVLDTASLNETTTICDTDKEILAGWYKEIGKSFSSGKRKAWLVTHKPTWAVLGKCDKFDFSNPTPQAALEGLPHNTLPENIKLALVGHKHLYASMDVNPEDEKSRMLELVAGNGGVVLNTKALSGCLKTGKKTAINAHGMSRFGFVAGRLNGGKSVDGWKLEVMAFKNVAGGGDWGGLVTAEKCEFPAKSGKPACEIKAADLFAKSCSSCEKADGKPGHACAAEDGDE
ncbi:MAG: metallophosphoesterase [Magnetococcales bacterium]|nr:metallophosphoesterase [Magnetococcales bacterium]